MLSDNLLSPPEPYHQNKPAADSVWLEKIGLKGQVFFLTAHKTLWFVEGGVSYERFMMPDFHQEQPGSSSYRKETILARIKQPLTDGFNIEAKAFQKKSYFRSILADEYDLLINYSGASYGLKMNLADGLSLKTKLLYKKILHPYQRNLSHISLYAPAKGYLPYRIKGVFSSDALTIKLAHGASYRVYNDYWYDHKHSDIIFKISHLIFDQRIKNHFFMKQQFKHYIYWPMEAFEERKIFGQKLSFSLKDSFIFYESLAAKRFQLDGLTLAIGVQFHML